MEHHWTRLGADPQPQGYNLVDEYVGSTAYAAEPASKQLDNPAPAIAAIGTTALVSATQPSTKRVRRASSQAQSSERLSALPACPPQLEESVRQALVGRCAAQCKLSDLKSSLASSMGVSPTYVENNKEVIKDVQLKESVVEMEEIIISTPFHKLQSENVMRIDKVSNEVLLNSGAMNLAQGIDLIPGVSSINTGNKIGNVFDLIGSIHVANGTFFQFRNINRSQYRLIIRISD